jgi:hypothetical protein
MSTLNSKLAGSVVIASRRTRWSPREGYVFVFLFDHGRAKLIHGFGSQVSMYVKIVDGEYIRQTCVM